jgi:hypothetical protein
MQHLKGQQELEREKERAKASAPTPRKVTSIGPRGRTEHTIDG